MPDLVNIKLNLDELREEAEPNAWKVITSLDPYVTTPWTPPKDEDAPARSGQEPQGTTSSRPAKGTSQNQEGL